MSNVDGYRIEPNLSKEEFIRKELIYIAGKKDVPIDVLDCNFKKIDLVYNKFALVKAKAKMDFIASIGYENDKTKQTEWQPFHANMNVSTVFKVSLDNNQSKYFSESTDEKVLLNLKSNDEQKKTNYMSLSYEEDVLIQKELDAELIKSCRNKLPGNRLKDFRLTEDYEILEREITVFEMPFYVAEYEYMGEKYKLFSSAMMSQLNLKHYQKYPNKSSRESKSANIDAEQVKTLYNKKTRNQLIRAVIASFIIAAVAFAIFALAVNIKSGLIVGLGALAVAMIVLISLIKNESACKSRYNEVVDELKEKYFPEDTSSTNLNIRVQKVTEILKKMSMACPSENEWREVFQAVRAEEMRMKEEENAKRAKQVIMNRQKSTSILESLIKRRKK